MPKQLSMSMGNVILREREISWTPSPDGMRVADSHRVLAFDVEPPCGGKIVNVAIIHEPDGPNPGLNIINKSGTMGVAAIQRMLILLEEWRTQKGLPPSNASHCLQEPINQ
jgi:hypothetical protein